MADLEALAAFLDINEQYDLAMAFDRDEEGNTSMAREHRKSAACHRAAAAACRELAEIRKPGFYADLIQGRYDKKFQSATDAALDAIKEARRRVQGVGTRPRTT